LIAGAKSTMVKWILIGLLALPVAEIGVFILVAASIGFLRALGLLLATTIAGFVVLRVAGSGRVSLFRSTVAHSGVSGIEARMEANPHGFLMVLAGVLLVIPGFITDVIGILLLLAPIRNWLGRRAWQATHGERAPDNSVIDLKEGEWQRLPEDRLEKGRD